MYYQGMKHNEFHLKQAYHLGNAHIIAVEDQIID